MDEHEYTSASPVPTNEPNQNDSADLLGLDKPIKLTTRAKVAKIDDDRILSKPTGIQYVVKNFNKMNRVMKKKDAALAKELSKEKYKRASTKTIRKLKHDHEFENFTFILHYYWFWLNTVFPKANFKDCIKLLRVYGAKSNHMKLYRRELLDQELLKLRQEKGIVDNIGDDIEESLGIAQPLASVDQSFPGVENENESSANNNNNNNEDEDDDDWSFMIRSATRPKNSLFIDDDEDDDELYRVTNVAKNPLSTQLSSAQVDGFPDLDEFSDSDVFSNPVSNTAQHLNENENENGDDFEMDLMREMDL
ncbi:putative chromosome segregation in meiosis protein 3 [[Candida] railenensis]|uniref:Chromosome segregation in meiosis protein n=1 Tax=[Candida] railenensis TaxID=45579 RepID=A0A9P0QKW7_9ASCO|nr:putative chromosome segregation in meiosis protein 3 [[Candida] railenensis]